MKKHRGFNLVELLVALAISAIVVMVVANTFINLNLGALFASNQLDVSNDLRSALSFIERDARRAGVFASFSFHQQSITGYSQHSASSPTCSTSEWCAFDTNTVGVKSDIGAGSQFSNMRSAVAAEGVTLLANSEILRLQYGGDKVAYLDPADYKSNCVAGHSCTLNLCASDGFIYFNNLYFVDQGIEKTSALYMLASANRAYLLSFTGVPFTTSGVANRITFSLADASGCSISSKPNVKSNLNVQSNPKYNYISYDPDMYSMQLVNFYTRYYFVGSKAGVTGLYVKSLQADGTLSSSMLISNLITSLKLGYKLNYFANSNTFNNFPSTTNNYAFLTTSAMSGSYWLNIGAMVISLSASSAQAVGSSMSKIQQTESNSVSWQ